MHQSVTPSGVEHSTTVQIVHPVFGNVHQSVTPSGVERTCGLPVSRERVPVHQSVTPSGVDHLPTKPPATESATCISS